MLIYCIHRGSLSTFAISLEFYSHHSTLQLICSQIHLPIPKRHSCGCDWRNWPLLTLKRKCRLCLSLDGSDTKIERFSSQIPLRHEYEPFSQTRSRSGRVCDPSNLIFSHLNELLPIFECISIPQKIALLYR